MNLIKSSTHNGGVLAFSVGWADVGPRIDRLVSAPSIRSTGRVAIGALLTAVGIGLRIWATVHFYEKRMKVTSLEPQRGPYNRRPFSILAQPAVPRRECVRIRR